MRTSLAPCVLLARLLHPADSASVVASDVGGLVAAVANSSIDHITLAPGHYLLSSQLYVERTLSIVAQVPATAVLDGQDLNRVLRIKEATVELTGLNITRGYSHSEQTGLSGGCVSITSGSVSIERSHIYTCRAYAVGGGIFVDFRGAPPSLLLTHSTVSGSVASTYGGGIYLGAGTAVLSGSALYHNVVDGGNAELCVASDADCAASNLHLRHDHGLSACVFETSVPAGSVTTESVTTDVDGEDPLQDAIAQ